MQQQLAENVFLEVCFGRNTPPDVHQFASAEHMICEVCLVPIPAHVNDHVVSYLQAKRTKFRLMASTASSKPCRRLLPQHLFLSNPNLPKQALSQFPAQIAAADPLPIQATPVLLLNQAAPVLLPDQATCRQPPCALAPQ